MELIIPFKETDYTKDGTHINSGKIIFELQKDWEETYHSKFSPYYANVIEGHPSVMQRIKKYLEFVENSDYDFGMELIDGEINIDFNLEIEKYSENKTIYAIGSQLHMDEEGDGMPIFLVKNDSLKDYILVLKYVPDEKDGDENSNVPINEFDRIKAK